MTKSKGSRFVTYFGPILDALRALGNSARPKEVYEWIAENLNIPEAELDAVNKNGLSNFENKVAWARFYLAKAGLIDTRQRGVWVLSDLGRQTTLSQAASIELFKSIHDRYKSEIESEEGDSRNKSEETVVEEVTAPGEKQYLNEDQVRSELVATLRALTDGGFEEFCALLLRTSGFENVTVSGKSGDEGIDGEGYLLINRFVRTKVMFQCKKYEGSVGPDKIRDFRGAIQGRAERGIFLTTGSFTRGAVEAAKRENATPIELVDIDRLVDLVIEQGLGVSESKALKIDADYFQKYSSTKAAVGAKN